MSLFSQQTPPKGTMSSLHCSVGPCVHFEAQCQSAQPLGVVPAAAIALCSGVTHSRVPKEPNLFISGWAMHFCSIQHCFWQTGTTHFHYWSVIYQKSKQCSAKESKVSFISKWNNLSETLKPKHFLVFQYLKQEQTELRNSEILPIIPWPAEPDSLRRWPKWDHTKSFLK